MNQINQMN